MNGNRFGRLFQVTTWGESHGPAIGATVSGCPAGLSLHERDVQAELDRRRPGQSMLTSSRDEPDAVAIESGLQDGHTTGMPIAMRLPNEDARPGKYEAFVTTPRPGHADYAVSAKFGTRSWAGGGRASGRETANWVAAGAIAKKLLHRLGVRIAAQVQQIGDVRAPEPTFEAMRTDAERSPVRCADPEAAAAMREAIEAHRREGDSLGGSVSFEARGVPRGLGAPRFDAVDARLGAGMLAIPATTAVEYGLGTAARTTSAATSNDPFTVEGDEVVPASNAHGGIQGGITTGRPITGEVTFHAPASIPRPQVSVDWTTNEPREIQVLGRHDPSLPPRGVPVVEAVLALVLVDFALLGGHLNPDRVDDRPGRYDSAYHPEPARTD
ncbi:MAG: chorismate synthase [Halobacteriales archaeon]